VLHRPEVHEQLPPHRLEAGFDLGDDAHPEVDRN
jgi:hypothetical protein